MKQVMQDLSKGGTIVVEAPAPKVSPGNLIIHTTNSLISAGTERMLVEFGKASLIDKARQQPDKVKMVLEKAKTDGIVSTFDAVKSKLSQPLPLGYCNVGIVKEVGQGVDGFQIGDRVVSNGSHADVIKVPKNLCAKIPDNVDDETAVFTVIASIGLQGVRLAEPTLGECFVVTGVGLIGLLTVQLLRASGCRVLAIDYDDKKLELAKTYGAKVCNPGKGEDPVSAGMAFSRGNGVDGVIITAANKSNDIISQSAQMSRKKGRVILIGVIGLDLNRADFYEKEIKFQVSCSYGPGRYDKEYEENGHDYPIGFVRWTEQRNFEAILDMMAGGLLNIESLISHRYNLEEAPDAYKQLVDDGGTLGIVLQHTNSPDQRGIRKVAFNSTEKFSLNKPVIGFIGAGNYASRVLIPAFKDSRAQLHSVVTSGGVSGVIHGEKAGFAEASTSTESILKESTVNTLVVVTRHNTHADLVCDALNSGKNVFVEKPLVISYQELERVQEAYQSVKEKGSNLHLMVGFNRRFSPHIQKVKSLLDTVKEPKSFIMTMNAGVIPANNWVQDPLVGGGRIVGEACHYIDLMRYLVGHEISSVYAKSMGDAAGVDVTEDKAVIVLGFKDGSFGTINYLANGASSFPKERIEVFAAGRVLQLDNFIKLRGFGWPDFKKMNLRKQDKGQNACVNTFLDAVERGKQTPITINEIFEVAKVSLDAVQMLRDV